MFLEKYAFDIEHMSAVATGNLKNVKTKHHLNFGLKTPPDLKKHSCKETTHVHENAIEILNKQFKTDLSGTFI